jgi:uncharacterized protein
MQQKGRAGIPEQVIAGKKSMLVSFSGGTDSSLLMAIAHQVLGERCHAVLLDSPLVSGRAVSEATAIARDLNVSFEIIHVPVLLDETFRKNSINRCYFCKKESAKVLHSRAKELGLACVADGANCSDLVEHRPGLSATDEEGFVHPFIEAGMTKEDIRDMARTRGYPFWNKPSAACLASRVPYGEEISEEKLRMIEEAEEYLADRGYVQFRVRRHGSVARIELSGDDIPTMVRERREVTGRLKEIGFSYVTLDLDGYRSGSMDEVL